MYSTDLHIDLSAEKSQPYHKEQHRNLQSHYYRNSDGEFGMPGLVMILIHCPIHCKRTAHCGDEHELKFRNTPVGGRGFGNSCELLVTLHLMDSERTYKYKINHKYSKACKQKTIKCCHGKKNPLSHRMPNLHLIHPNTH